jgi:hypothetical protein
MTAIAWLLGTVLLFLAFGLVAGSTLGGRRRRRFHLRVVALVLTLSVLAVTAGLLIDANVTGRQADGAIWLALLVASLAVAPLLCFGLAPQLPPDDGGWEGRSPQPEAPPPPSPSGCPLPDAEQSSARRRDHRRPSLRDRGSRRPAREPQRTRTPSRR